MRRPLGQRGVSLIELVLGLSITALIIPALAALVWAYIWVPPRQSDELASFNDVDEAVYWVMRDANVAESFTAGTAPQYGYFQWTDYTSGAAEAYKATYYYQSGELLRDLTKNEVLQGTTAVSRYIASQGDVSFTWSPTTYSVAVSATSTVQGANSTQPTTYTSAFTAFLRTSKEGEVSPPGLTPVPTPPPGSVTYYVAADPVLIYGTWVSGNAASLQSADGNYYTVYSGVVGGAKEVTYTVYSQTITSPVTIAQLEVRWTGRSSRTSTAMQFFVKDSSGTFPATANSGFTFTVADTIITHSFLLDAAKVSYINSVRRVDLKVDATNTATFTLDSDQIRFIASP